MFTIDTLYKRAKTPEQKMALDNCIGLFLTGSHLYGTSTPESDYDYEGVFIEPPEYVLGTKSCTEVSFNTGDDKSRNSSEDYDCRLYSLRKYLQLAQQNNPNKIEWFFIPLSNFIYVDFTTWSQIASRKDIFLSKKVEHSFSGYATSQKNKLISKRRRYLDLKSFKEILEEALASGKTRVGDLDILEEYEHKKYHKDTDTLGITVNKRIKHKYEYIKYKKTQEGSDCIQVDQREYNFGMYLIKIFNYVDRELKGYGGRLEYIKEFGFDLKFAAHLFRLFYEGLDLANTGKLQFPLPQNQIDYMLEVKKGKYTIDEMLTKADIMEKDLVEAFKENKANLPHSPNHSEIDKLQQQIMTDFWKLKKLI